MMTTFHVYPPITQLHPKAVTFCYAIHHPAVLGLPFVLLPGFYSHRQTLVTDVLIECFLLWNEWISAGTFHLPFYSLLRWQNGPF